MSAIIRDFFVFNMPLPVMLPAIAVFSVFSIWFSVLDIKTGEIPRIQSIVMLATLCIARIGMIFNTGFSVSGIHETLITPFTGAAFALFIFTGVFLACRGKMGLADVWFATAMGIVLGLRYFILAVLIACILGILWFGLMQILSKVRGHAKNSSLPLIPFLATGSLLLIAIFICSSV